MDVACQTCFKNNKEITLVYSDCKRSIIYSESFQPDMWGFCENHRKTENPNKVVNRFRIITKEAYRKNFQIIPMSEEEKTELMAEVNEKVASILLQHAYTFITSRLGFYGDIQLFKEMSREQESMYVNKLVGKTSLRELALILTGFPLRDPKAAKLATIIYSKYESDQIRHGAANKYLYDYFMTNGFFD